MQTVTWINLQGIILSKKKKKKNHTILFHSYLLCNDRILETQGRLSVARGLGVSWFGYKKARCLDWLWISESTGDKIA